MDCIYLAQKYSKPLVSAAVSLYRLMSCDLVARLTLGMGILGRRPPSRRFRSHPSGRTGLVNLGSKGQDKELPVLESHDVVSALCISGMEHAQWGG
jgi:hypothetical protein